MSRLIAEIRDAFADVVFPGEGDLTTSFGEEAEALVRDFRTRDDWRTLTPEFLNQAPEGWGTALSFFSGPALRFYLAAYLIADIEGTLAIGDASTRLCAFVAPGYENKRLAKFYGGGTLGEHARKEFALFSPPQVSVIVDYLWWKLEQSSYDPTIEQALENYWLERDNAREPQASRPGGSKQEPDAG